MVGANPYRNPALVAKMVTALDHISGGRAYLGIGSAWDESEAQGLRHRHGRVARRAPALAARGTAGDARHAPRRGAIRDRATLRHGRRAQRAAAGPEAALLIVVAAGEKVTLRLVARYADACNIGFANGDGGVHAQGRGAAPALPGGRP